MTAVDWVALTLLGGGGALLRYAVDGAIERRSRSAFPLGTLAINVSGAFALGVLTGAHAGSEVLFVFGTGLIGSFTTFSTWMFETHRRYEGVVTRSVAAWNVALTLAAGLAAAGAGWWLAASL